MRPVKSSFVAVRHGLCLGLISSQTPQWVLLQLLNLEFSHAARQQPANSKVDSKEHLQLATARLPKGLDTTGFTNSLYQWASTLTSSGQNMPFALPIKADKLENGFQMSLLRIKDGRPMSVGDIVANVEQVDEKGDVLFVRFFEGPAAGIDRQGPAPSNPRERLQKNAEALIDVPIIMQTMKVAIQKAVAQNK
ncbi:hypothetical protein WJX79_007632 [Trebouxia sp. C0005]